jgi:hypothetical protein
MSRRTLPIQERQLQQQRRLLRGVVEPSRDLPDRQNQAPRFESPADQQRHASNQ